jgi:hypothetical protein
VNKKQKAKWFNKGREYERAIAMRTIFRMQHEKLHELFSSLNKVNETQAEPKLDVTDFRGLPTFKKPKPN